MSLNKYIIQAIEKNLPQQGAAVMPLLFIKLVQINSGIMLSCIYQTKGGYGHGEAMFQLCKCGKL